MDNVKLITFLEFVVGTYVMSLPAELVFIPFVTVVMMLDAVAKLDEKTVIAKITTSLLVVIGFAIFGFAVSQAICDFRNLGTAATVRTILFPPLMSIAFVPFIYILVVVAIYESIFIRLAVGHVKAPVVVRYAKCRIFLYCGLSLSRVRALAKRPPVELMQIETSADVDRLFTSVLRANDG